MAPQPESIPMRRGSSSSSGPTLPTMALRTAAQKTLGICFLSGTVLLWTLSSFATSSIFSDQTFNKPFFLYYANNILFALSIAPRFARYLRRNGISVVRRDLSRICQRDELAERLLSDDSDPTSDDGNETADTVQTHDNAPKLHAMSLLALEFCLPWLLSDYLSSACLAYTSVASTTILTSTSSIWTLVFAAAARIEALTLRKSASVLASLAGIALISTVDLSGSGSSSPANSPWKPSAQVATGDLMALASAVIYGAATTRLKVRMAHDDGSDMRLFLGLQGVFSLLLLWPIFFLLHWTGLEVFEMPPTAQIWGIIAINSAASFVGDLFWAYALLLISPLVVTLGLSMTIPLSLVGEMVQYHKYASLMYWLGAAIMLLSFILISGQEKE